MEYIYFIINLMRLTVYVYTFDVITKRLVVKTEMNKTEM